MSLHCPTCSRVNPADAGYCYYDGRALGQAGPKGPLGFGTLRFPLPFCFSDGSGCADYNQLALACDRRWNEARRYLVDGTWASFFSSIGRSDLAFLAVQSAKETDPDIGLCRLLEGLPADAEALRPPKLVLTSTAEDLGALEPGKDHKVELVIENQGMLLLRGLVMMDCDWLSFGDRQGNISSKLFQTRDTYALAVRVMGSKVRAGKKPLEGVIIIDTNGGRQTVAVRATVPIRPFPRGQGAGNVLGGATSPREVAVKAKAHPQEAAVLFEQGAVKAWYESNGWTYPIQGTQARGKGALQQFFEALGLTKPPHLEIDTERIVCEGEAGQRLTKKVTLRTAEARFVHAEAHSDQGWIKVQPARSHANSATIPLCLEIPPRPGETFRATVTVHGNGQQRFVVPVSLTVAGVTPEQEERQERRSRRLEWITAGVVLVLFVAGATWVARVLFHRVTESPVVASPGSAAAPIQSQQPVARWWDRIPNNNFTDSVTKLKQVAGANQPLFESLETGLENDDRRKGYEQLAAKLPELARDPAAREPLGRFVTECCVHEPSEFNITPLLRGLARQFPAEDSPFPPGDKGEEVERASFWLGVVCDTITHKATRPDRSRSLASELDTVFRAGLDPDVPPDELKDKAEKSLAEQCYHNTLPTAEKSVEQALTIREVVLAKFGRHLTPDFRGQDDVQLLALGASKDHNLWPKLEPIFRTCVESNEINVGFKLIDVYQKADAELAPKMEVLLAVKWKAAADPKLTRVAKAEAIRERMAARASAAKISHAQRVKQLQALLEKSPLSPAKPGGQQKTTQLQDAERLAHASTLASILFNKDAEVGRFDELIRGIPGTEQVKVVNKEKKPEEKPQQPGATEVLDAGAGPRIVASELTEKNAKDPRRDAYRQEYWVRMKAGETYYIDMRSTELTPYIRLESLDGKQQRIEKGANAHIIANPPVDGDYPLVVSSVDKEAKGHFTLQVTLQVIRRPHRFPFGAPFGHPFGPPPMPQAPGAVEKKAAQLNQGDLKDLGDPKSNVRTAAFKNLAGSAPNDLAYRHARTMAKYLLVTEWADADLELQAVTDQLPALGKCRNLLEALADVVADGDKLGQQRTEAIVGGLLVKQLQFARGEDWQSACRKLLLQRALELTGSAATPTNDADKTADFLRDLYKEQGLAFGLEGPDFEEQTQLTPVLERLIKHVAARAAQQELPPAEKASVEQIDRQLQVARFTAANDLEHTVLLQRIWIKVLVFDLQGRVPAQAKEMMTEVQRDLDKKDRESGTLLDQLRSGEEKVLRVWALALDLKLK